MMDTTPLRRNRRKPRTVSAHALLALHKYYLRAEYMRGLLHEAKDRLVARHGAEALKIRTASAERFQVEMYLDYWYAGIFVAIEGYEKLALHDPEVENLCRDPLYRKLREYRAGTYHFREKYFDDAIRSFLADPTSGIWMTEMGMALGRFLLAELAARRVRRAETGSASPEQGATSEATDRNRTGR